MNLIVIEGLDGAGKSTQIELLRGYFALNSLEARYLHFPRTDSPYFGDLISRFLRGEFGSIDEIDPYLVALLYAGDRNDAAHLIENWLKNGTKVLLDRYVYSNIAYQCAKLADKELSQKLKEWIKGLEFEHFGIPKPSINIFLDVPLSFTELKLSSGRSGDDRSYLKGKFDIHESSMPFQARVRDIYLETAIDDPTLQILDCSSPDGGMLSADDIHKLIIKLLRENKLII